MLRGEFENDFYDWLYNRYAYSNIDEKDLDENYHENMKKWIEVVEKMSDHEKLVAKDMMDTTKYFWGLRSFMIGVKAGIMLIADLPEGP